MLGVRSLDSSTRRASGKSSATSSAMRSTPGPHGTSECSAPQFGHVSGIGTKVPQWWHSSLRRNLCSTSQAEQFGHSNLKPHFRQSVTGA